MVAALGWLPSLTHLPQAPLLLSCSLRPLDIEFLRRLCRTVNVVPVIARADSLTIEERDAFRSRVIWVAQGRARSGGREQNVWWAEVMDLWFPRSSRT